MLLKYKQREVFLIIRCDFCGERVAFFAQRFKQAGIFQRAHHKRRAQGVHRRTAEEHGQNRKQRIPRRPVVRLCLQQAVP